MTRTDKDRNGAVTSDHWIDLCVVSVHIVVDFVDASLAMKRAGTSVTLRQSFVDVDHVTEWCVESAGGSDEHVALVALAKAFRALFVIPERVVSGGLLSIEQVDALWQRTRIELDDARAFQRGRPSEIVATAKALKLHTDTNGRSPGMWSASCPGRNHDLELQTSTDLFCCGYCRVGGGPQELCELVSARRG